ncbi:MAG: hypothetical protein HN348_25505, partial [Proteobacteria bacterium]|nr:hypothetical protein [Pseudomonadota bacterium]
MDNWASTSWESRDLQIAKDLMDPAKRTTALRDYLEMHTSEAWFEDEDLLWDTLQSLSPEERTAMISGPGGEAMLGRIREDLGANEIEMLDALTNIDEESGLAMAKKEEVAAAKMLMAMKGAGDWWLGGIDSWGTDESEVMSQLSDLSPEEVKKAMAYYNQNCSGPGETFQTHIHGELSGAPMEVIQSELAGDKVAADAWRLKYAAQEDFWDLGGTDEKLIEDVFKSYQDGKGGRKPAQFAEVGQRFETMFGGEGGRYNDESGGRSAMEVFLDDELSGLDRQFLGQMATKGEADPELEIMYAMRGAGTDEERVKDILKKMYE